MLCEGLGDQYRVRRRDGRQAWVRLRRHRRLLPQLRFWRGRFGLLLATRGDLLGRRIGGVVGLGEGL